MKIVLLVYLIIATTTYISLLTSSKLYTALRSGINSKERIKVDKKMENITESKKFSIIWPYVLYKLIK